MKAKIQRIIFVLVFTGIGFACPFLMNVASDYITRIENSLRSHMDLIIVVFMTLLFLALGLALSEGLFEENDEKEKAS